MAGSPHVQRSTVEGSGSPELGLRRINWVLIAAGEDGLRCHVVGLGHRLPIRRTVPLGTAAALIASGTPYALRTAPATTGPAQQPSHDGERV